LGILITHAFRAFVHRRNWTELSLWALVPRVSVSILLLSCVLAVAFVTPIRGFSVEIPGQEVHATSDLVARFVNGIVFFTLWSAVYFGLHWFWSYRQAEVEKWRLEAQAKAARLDALKLQLNPHFFFNSLNSVRALIAQDPDRAQKMTTRLARLLRNTLMVEDKKTVSLREELATVRSYLELEKVRLEDRLRSDITVEEDLKNAFVPHLMLQILAENGIKHGIAERSEGGQLTISARRRDDTICIRVTNPGDLDDAESGMGLTNTRERLRLLFGDAATLTLEEDEGIVQATARLPICTEPPDSTEVGSVSAEERPWSTDSRTSE
jgi:LytS/YehU family sensor histidine kinase